jgi:hypothetical protein
VQGNHGGEATDAYVAFTYTQAGEGGTPDVPQVLYVTCRSLADGVMLRVVHIADQAEYDAQAKARDTLLAGLVLAEPPAATNPRPTEPPGR